MADIELQVDFEGFGRKAKWANEPELRSIIGANVRKAAFKITKKLEVELKKQMTVGLKDKFKRPVKGRNAGFTKVKKLFWKRDLPNFKVLQTQDAYIFYLGPSGKIDLKIQEDLNSKTSLRLQLRFKSRSVPGRHLRGARNVGKGQTFSNSKGKFVRKGKKTYMVKSYTAKSSNSSIEPSHFKSKAISIYSRSGHFREQVDIRFRRIIEILNK